MNARHPEVYAVIDNDYGPPAPGTLRMLSGLPTTVLRTTQCGDAVVLADPYPNGHPAGLATRCRD